eukprot:TRINITY_DN13956_c0_g1_i1.p1 TRINITY_DN13956_c0_g1~~TRINITY_DN13956_c0_g1_i1.p1  ORF type:complete len:385 (-),score=73.69 TRINITY_DN13956_c0_g1_i1:80-1156(-)
MFSKPLVAMDGSVDGVGAKKQSLPHSVTSWSSADAEKIEGILRGVGDEEVPQIEEVISSLARILNLGDDMVILDPCDPVLTDAMRCILSHRWLVPSIQAKDVSGKTVASFFMQPFRNGKMLSLFSSHESFSHLQKEAKRVGAKVTATPLTFGQVVMRHLPNMTLEAMQKNHVAEAHAVRALSIDPYTMQDVDETGENQLIVFSDLEFSLLQSFCYCYALAGSVFDVKSVLEECPAAVTAKQWDEVLCKQTLHAIMVDDDNVFASAEGLLFFIYPGDAVKVLMHHKGKGMAGLKEATVAAVEPQRVLHLLRWRASEEQSSLILATVMAATEDGELEMHGLEIRAKTFKEVIEPQISLQE